jgi:hypothetical protein
MADTPNLVLPYLAANQSQKHVTVNEALRRLDALVQVTVQSAALGTPPASPTEGQRWIIPASPSGAWAGHEGQIVAWQDGTWAFYAPQSGWSAVDISTGTLLMFDAGTGTWVGLISSVFSDANFTLQDDLDPTRQARFELAGVAAGTTRVFTLPDATTALAGLAVAQTFSAKQTLSNANNDLGTSTGSGSTNLATGATLSGNTKTVNIGTAGVSGSTTNIAIGSAVAGALGTLTINSPSVIFETSVSAIAMAAANVSALYLGLGGATADATDRLSINAPARLFNHAGAGHQVKVNKAAATDTGSFLFQTGFSGRAEFGLTGSDDFQIKVSSDGASWATALIFDRSTGRARAPNGIALIPAAGDLAAASDGDIWYNVTSGKFRARQDGANLDLIGGGGGGGGGGLTPAGADGDLQIKSGSGLAAPADVTTEGGQLRLGVPASVPTAPAAAGIKLFGPLRGAHPMPHILRPDGIITAVQGNLGQKNVNLARPAGGTTLSTIGTTLTAIGTATSSSIATSTLHQFKRRLDYLVTAAAVGAIAGYRGNTTFCTVGNSAAGAGGFLYTTQWGPATGVSNTAKRGLTGLSASVSTPSDANPSTMNNQIGMGCDAGDTNWQMIFTNVSSFTKIDLGAGFPVSSADRTDVYELTMYSPAGASQRVDWEVVNLVTGAVASGSQTATLPPTTAFLGYRAWMSSGTASAVSGYAIFSLYCETDY